MRFFCSNDGSELWNIYDPNTDEDILVGSQHNNDFFNSSSLSDFEKNAIMARQQTLIETLEKLNENKRMRYNEIITKQSAVILVCPYCKRVYDSNSIVLKEKSHVDGNNITPFKRPSEHKIISDDKESIEDALTYSDLNNNPFESGSNNNQVYFSQDSEEEEEEQKKTVKSNATMYKQKHDFTNLDNLKHAKNQLKLLKEKFGDDVSIDIYLPNPE